jgi:protein-tyrosine phosphatase
MTSEIYWISDLDPGRLAILGRPRAGDWLDDEVAGWASAGITDVVSLLEDHEMRDLDLRQEPDVARGAGLVFERFPIPDRGVPASAPAAREFCGQLAVRVRSGRSVGVHCRAGIGRSALMVVGTLMSLGLVEADAWQRTSKARGVQVPDTEEQRAWVRGMVGK